MSDETDRSQGTEEPTHKGLGETRRRKRAAISRGVRIWFLPLVGRMFSAMRASGSAADVPMAPTPTAETLSRVRGTATACVGGNIETPPLARALYAGVALDDRVSAAHYQVPAAVTRYVWSLQGGVMPEDRQRDE